MAIEKHILETDTNFLVLVNDINKLTTAQKIKYYRLLDQCDKTKKYAHKIVIKQETCDIVQMHDIIEILSGILQELETHVQYMSDGISYQEAKMEFDALK